MGYSSLFKRRMDVKGSSRYDRKFNKAQRSFEKWFENTLTRESVTIDGIEQFAVLQDQNQSNNKDLSDDKYIITPNSSNMKVGSYVNWRDSVWMVFTEENKTIPTHKQAKLKESNHTIKWMISGRISGNGEGYPAYVQNQTLYTLGVSTSGHNAWIVNAKMMMYMQNNEESHAIRIGQRLFIGDDVYQVMFKDTVSRHGLINYLLEQDFVNEDRDNVELKIADYYSDGRNDQDDTDPLPETVISGADKIRVGSISKYESSKEIVDWTIDDVDSVATIVDQTPNNITISVERNFKYVGSTITVIGRAVDGSIGSKKVFIISPY